MNTYISSKSGTLLLSACQDWHPLSARADSQDCGDDGDHEDCGGQELQPCTDGLPMFPEDSLNVEKELGVIFENLEEQLPEVPLPGPPVPQIQGIRFWLKAHPVHQHLLWTRRSRRAPEQGLPKLWQLRAVPHLLHSLGPQQP